MDSMNRPNPNQKQDKISDFEEKGEYIEYEEIK